jgi:ArsR family transcriptional regulator
MVEQKLNFYKGEKMAKNQFVCDCKTIHEEDVQNVKDHMLGRRQLAKVHKFCDCIGNDTRLKILWALKTSALCVCDLANVLSMTKSATSHQLKILKDASLITCEKKGKEVLYSLADDHIKIILDMVAIHVMESY